MNKSVLLELCLSMGVGWLVVLLFNPWGLWMPMETHLMLVGVTIGLVVGLGWLALRKIKEDEREESLRLFSYKSAYMAGLIVLLVGIVKQSFLHDVDGWLVGAVLLMLGIKLGALWVGHVKR